MGGGGILGGITDFVGLTDYESQESTQQAAVTASERASANALKMAEDNIAFQKEQYADWKAVYGEIQSNLGEYYKNLSSSKYATQSVQANQQEFNKVSKQLDTQLAQRGLSQSGVQAASMVSMNQQLAQANAQARYTAKDQVSAQQAGFLGIGLGQGSNMLGNIGSAYSSGASSALQGGQLLTGARQNQSNMFGAWNKETMDATGQVAGGIMSAMSDIRLKNNIKYTHTIDSINFYTWDWNDVAARLGYDRTKSSGVIAQELKLIYPECVSTTDYGYYYVDYERLYKILGVNNG